MNTPTPRTEEAVRRHRLLGCGPFELDGRFADFARILETELAAITAERDQLRAEVERVNALGSWAHTCIHHNDKQRTECPVCLVTTITAERDHWQKIAVSASQEREHNANVAQAMTAERDQLRAELALLREWQREVIQNANAHHAERKDANARAERAEADLATAKELLRTEAMDDYASIKDLQSELAAEREKAERYRLVTLRQDAELATERARLDWLEGNAAEITKYNSRSFIWFANQNIRAAIDAGIKEDAK